MKECSKSISRRLRDPNFINRYFVGKGIDVGGKPDPLCLYQSLFSRMEEVRTWDQEDGDGQDLANVGDEEYDFLHSSHCLEHLKDPRKALRNWLRVVKPGGYLIITVPDEDLYEQGVFPSTFSDHHKWTFTIYKKKSWSRSSLNLLELIQGLGQSAELLRMEQLTETYRFELPRYDQTLTPIGECGIEFVIRKRPEAEAKAGGSYQRKVSEPEREARVHLNQYVDDRETLKKENQSKPPFNNDGPLGA